jgi:hypothetical protein
MKTTPIVITCAALTLVGCGDALIRQTSTPAYADGYKEGCDNSSSASSRLTTKTRVRNDKRYFGEPEYMKGWDAGNRECNGGNFLQNPNNPLQPIDLNGPSTVSHEDY